MSDFNWKGKRVLITGHTGFKGSWLSLWLQALGAETYGYALAPSTEPSLFELANVGSGMESILADIGSLDRMQAVFDRVRPEVVLHLAAQAIVQVGYQEPVETFSTNVMGTVHVLECVRRTASVRSVVVATSDKCYRNEEWHWSYRENSELGGRDPYAASKSCAELIVHSYRASYFNPEESGKPTALVASVRAGNVIGGGDWAPYRLIPDIVATLREDRPLVLRHPKAIRPWQHVLEPLRGYLQVAENLYNGDLPSAGPWNFGPVDEDCLPVAWLAQELSRKWGREAQWQSDRIPHPHEDTFLKLDCSKARALLGWAPVLRLDDGLQWIADWYQALDRGENMRAVTIAQIESYRALAAERSERALNAAV